MDFIVGGYYLIQGSKLQEWMNAKLLPPILWSASHCICEKVPDSWVLTWVKYPDPFEVRQKYQRELGMTGAGFLELQKHFDRLFDDDDFGYPNVFMNYQVARNAYSQYFYKIPDLKLISVALAENEVQSFIKQFEPQRKELGENGVRKKLRQYQKVEPFAAPMGYDVLGYDYADFESLICGSLEGEILEKYGVHFNRYGMINSLEDGAPIVQDIRSGALKVEEGYWASWLISEYPLSV